MTTKAAPGRPRNNRLDETILREAVRELSIGGIRNFSIVSIARRAKVAKATIYLRWSDRNMLILDALKSTGRSLGKPQTGTLKGDLRILVNQWATIHRDPELTSIFGRIFSEGDAFPEIVQVYRQQMVLPANLVVETVIREAQRRGEVRSDADAKVAARCLVGALVLESRFNHSHISADFEHQLVEILYVGLRSQ